MIIPKRIGLVVKPELLEEQDDTLKRAKELGFEIVGDSLDREQASVDRGTVITIGGDAWKDFNGEPWCKVGDFIAFARFAGKQVTDPETKEKFLIINDEDVVCILKEGTKNV